MKVARIHTDGGCEPNPGPGGWAAVLEMDGHIHELSGGALATTNNRMEMQAAIEALRALPEPCQVELLTDSQYLRKGICEWLKGWKAHGWKTAAKQPVKNQDLWQQLDALVAGHTIHWRWLKGHAGHKFNERCDELAGAEIAKLRQQYPGQNSPPPGSRWQRTGCPFSNRPRCFKAKRAVVIRALTGNAGNSPFRTAWSRSAQRSDLGRGLSP